MMKIKAEACTRRTKELQSEACTRRITKELQSTILESATHFF
jgi:hypothetical protein